MKLLEIGVRKGGSLQLWRDYFPQATIVGIDLRLPENFAPGKRLQLFEGDQADTAFLSEVAYEGLTNLINGQNDLIVCGEAEDSAGAITGIAKTRPDGALVDISLKNESGLELVKNLESQFPLVALIVLSMHDEALNGERALRAGARGYVMKRESTKSVLASIRRVLKGAFT